VAGTTILIAPCPFSISYSTSPIPTRYDDQFSSNDFWKTTLGNKIKILPDENKYYD
jgi:hypothetical protein